MSGAVKMPLTCTRTEKKNLTDLTMRKATQFEGDKGGEDDKVIMTHVELHMWECPLPLKRTEFPEV